MGSHITKPSNKSMVDKLVEHNSYIRSPIVEGVFRAVDRAMYYDLEEGETIDPYENEPWRRGNLHLSAPCIYAKVVEALDLRSGLSFLNLGSGTGYLNTIVGLLVGPIGLNHGLEIHSDVIEYAYERLQQFKQNSFAIDKYDFSEPMFIKGNCLNLNPDNKYDRIYLGAACLPDLEGFMKKLIKPNGGILVMPYEGHLIRYIRIAETEWISEKLMEVNFTLMIRPGDNESMIDMPLAQAKSLKELCRITIRQHLRDKTNSMNPNLLHSDNIRSRRMRKAKAERKMIRKERQRVIAKDPLFLDHDKFQGNKYATKRPKSRRDDESRGCRCRRLVEEIEESTPSSSREVIKPSGSSSTTTTSRTRVMTRSASRFLGSLATNPNTSTSSLTSRAEQSVSSRDTSPNGLNLRTTTSSLDSSESDDDNDDDLDNNNSTLTNNTASNRNSARQDGGNNCARTRPFVCTMRDRPTHAIPLAYRSNPGERRLNEGPPPLLPFHRQMARTIDPPTSSSSSDSSDLQELSEYDYVSRRVVLDWPGFLRIHNSDPAYDISDSQSLSSESTLSSADLILDDNASEDSWDSFFDNLPPVYDTMDDEEEEEAAVEDELSQLDSEESNPDDDDYGIYNQAIDDDVEIDNDSESSFITSTDAMSPPPLLPTTSHTKAFRQAEKRGLKIEKPTPKLTTKIGESAAVGSFEQEPVARRLRSKQLSSQNDELNDNDSQSNSTAAAASAYQRDRLGPSCSRSGACQRSSSLRHGSDRTMHLRSRSSSSRSSVITGQQQQQTNLACPASSLSSTTAAANQNPMNNESNHSSSSVHPAESSEASADLMGNSSNGSQGLFTGRVLIATALGTTLSLAAHHYHHVPSTSSRGGSFRLFERRALNSLMPTSYHRHCHHLQQQQQLQSERKRKRHSSSDSSDTSDSSTPNNNNRSSSSRVHRGGRVRRHCKCGSKSSLHLSSSRDPPATTTTGSSATSQQSATAQSSSSARWSETRRQGGTSASQSMRGKPEFLSPTSRLSGRASSGRPVEEVGTERSDNSTTTTRQSDTTAAADADVRQHRHHHHHHHHHHNRHSHYHHRHLVLGRDGRLCEAQSLDGGSSNKRRGRITGGSERKRRSQRKRTKRHSNECERYHIHLSRYISRLPLPLVLHGYLNYERKL